MTPNLSLVSLAAALLLAAPAQAVSLTASQLNGNSLNTDFSTASLISFDLALDTGLPISLEYSVDADDLLRGGIGFNALVAEYSGAGIPGLRVGLLGASFDVLGSARASSSMGEALETLPVSQGGAVALDFSPAQGGVVNEIYLGDPFAEGFQDWHVDFTGLQAGDHFTLNVAVVPEPAEWALMLAGLMGLAWQRRRARG